MAGEAAGLGRRQVVAFAELGHQFLLALHQPVAERFHVEAGLLLELLEQVLDLAVVLLPERDRIHLLPPWHRDLLGLDNVAD